MSEHKHKFKIGDKVMVGERTGIIQSIGYNIPAEPGTPPVLYTICDDKKVIPEHWPLGYQVYLNQVRMVKIVPERMITALE